MLGDIDLTRWARDHGEWMSPDDYFEWCHLRDDGTLEFGDEQGNYAGGVTFAIDFCEGGEQAYWRQLRKLLKYYKENNSIFYARILDIINRHDVKIPFRDEL